MSQDPQNSGLISFDLPQFPTTEEALKSRYESSIRADAVAAAGPSDLISNAINETWALAPWFAEAHSTNFEFDPSWAPTPEQVEAVKRELPETAWDDAIYAKNEDHYNAVVQDVKNRQQTQAILAERFGPATLIGSYFAAGFLDPVNLSLMAATGPTYSAITQSGKFAMAPRFLRVGALAGTEAVAWATLRQTSGDTLLDEADILTIGGFGAVIGGAFGAIFGKYMPEVSDKTNAFKFATDGATISEAGFRTTQRGQKRWLVPRHLDDEPTVKFRPPALYDENQRAYGYVSVLGTPGRGTVGINIAKSPFEEMSFLQGGIVQYKNKNIKMTGYINIEDGDLVVRFNVDSVRTKGMVDISELRDIETMVNSTMRDFLDDMDAHGLGDFLRRTGAADPSPNRPAPKLLGQRRPDTPEVSPDEALSMLPMHGRVIDGDGNARIVGDSAITIEARVDKMVQDHGIESLDRWVQSFKTVREDEYLQMVTAASKPGRSVKEIEDIVRSQVVRRAKEMFTAYLRDISENRHLGKEFIDSLEDFRPLAKLSGGVLERSDVFSLRNFTKHKLRDSVHAAAAEREAARVIADVPAGQHFKGGVLEEAYRISRDPKTDVHLVWMSPEEFSGFALPLKPGVLGDKGESVESLVELLKGGTKLDEIPKLTIVPAPKREAGVYEVTSHNGRHRAEAFRELGINEIPVLIKGGEGSNIKGSSISSLSVSPPTILRNERGWGKKAFKDIVQEDKPFPIRQSPSITFASIDEATAALRRDAILAKGPKLTISASKAAPKASRRIATEYTATISDDAHKLFNKELHADFNFPIPKEVRIKVRTKEEGLNEEGGKYNMYMWGEEVPLVAMTKKELGEEIHSVMETPILVPKLAKHFEEDKLIGPQLPEVPALLALSRASKPDELSGFTTMRGNKELTNAEIQRLIHESDPALRPYGEVMIWYHGTREQGFVLPTAQPVHSGDVFASPNRDWAFKWSYRSQEDQTRVIEMVITPKNVFDGGNPDHIRKFVEAQLSSARDDVITMERKLAEAVKASDPMAVLHADAVRASQSILDRLLRSLESDKALRKYGAENLTGWSGIEKHRDAIKKLGFDSAFEQESVQGLTAQNIRLFDPENQIHVAKKAKESLMPTELVAVKQGHLLKLDELETIIGVVETKHPEYALTPAWQRFLSSVAEHRQSAHRPQSHRSVRPDDITIDIPPTKKQPKKKPFEGVSEEEAAKFRAQAARFDELAEDLQPGDRIMQIGDVVFIYNARTGRGISLQDLVDEINKSADDVAAETARQENRVFNKRNLDAFKNTVSRGGDDAAVLDFDAAFKEAGVHGPTLGGPGTRAYNSRKSQLQNTLSDAFNWLALHGFGNQAGAETRAGQIVTVIDDVNSWMRHGLSIDRDNLGVSLASDTRKVHNASYKEWKQVSKQNFGDIFSRRSRATFRRDVARFLRNSELLDADPSTLSKSDQLVQKTAQSYADTYAKTLQWLVKNDPEGPWADIAKQPNRNYFPRIFSEAGHKKLINEFGEEQIQELIATAIQQGSKNGEKPMSRAQAMRFAELYTKKVGGNKFQMSWLNHPKWGRKDPKQFMQMLIDELGVSSEEAARFTALFAKKVDDGTHGKYRVRLDETVSLQLTDKSGNSRTVSFDELLNNDVASVTDRYLHSVLSVAGEREIVRMFSDKMNIEGVLKSLDDLRPHIIDDLTKKGTNLRDAEEMFDNLAREIKGNPHTDSMVFSQNARILRDANYVLGAGSGFGLSALGDVANSLFSHGGRNALQAIGILRKMTKSGARLDIDDDIKTIAEAAALSDRKLDAMRMNPIMDELGDLPGTGGKVAETLRQGATTMSDISGINAVTLAGENLAMKVHALRYIRMMLDDEVPNKTRLAQMGYTEEAWRRDAAYMRRNAKRYVGADGIETIKPNFGEWEDQSGVRRFIAAIESEVTSQVIRSDSNDLPAMFHRNGFAYATGQLLLQFKNFGITATRAMLVRNVKANDARAYITFLSAVVGGGLVYTIKQRLRHSDDEEAFQESMQFDRWVQGAFSHSAVGATTEIVDAAKALITGTSMVGNRFAPSDEFLGDIPVARSADAIFRTAGIPFKLIQGKELSPGDYRALKDISLIGNHPVVRVGANALQTQEN